MVKSKLQLHFKVIFPLLFLIVSVNNTFAQVSGMIVYKTEFRDNPNLPTTDTLYFDGDKIKFVSNKSANKYRTKENFEIKIAEKHEVWFFNLRTRESILKKYNIATKAYEYTIDTLKPLNWVILDEFKMIGKFKAQHAYIESEEPKTHAWFVPEIKLQVGPENTWGLPGLIVELFPWKRWHISLESMVNMPVSDVKFNENVVFKSGKRKLSSDKEKLKELLNNGG